jgi:hypothetical protein
MRIDQPIRDQLAALHQDLAAIEAALDQPKPVPVLCVLYTRLADTRADLRHEFPRFFEARRPMPSRNSG